MAATTLKLADREDQYHYLEVSQDRSGVELVINGGHMVQITQDQLSELFKFLAPRDPLNRNY